ncbi:hypothetical protein WR25_01894 [Diploscapter pachys]|uniref:Activin types I and II receptor domain-containing protein n=1 Tax=Diploscapter pachys TaxID=2018661 RepID=A0A2A2KY27_9BILA|nr:hypothetical protein WR25_01894 [Diploscapter pachys]
MSSVRLLAALILLVPVYVFCLQCAICPFKIDEPHNLDCPNETCTGDVCNIVVNRYYNATIIAGCMQLREGDSFDKKALCYRSEFKTVCACSTEDMCNDPSASLSNFEFTDKPFLENYQFMPQISPNPVQVSPLGGEVEEGSLAPSTNNETLTVQSAMTVLPPSESIDNNSTLAETVEAKTEVEPEAEGSGSIATDVPLMESTTMRKLTSAIEGQDIVLTKTVNLEVGENQNATEIPLTVTSVGNNLMNVDEVASTESNPNVQPK